MRSFTNCQMGKAELIELISENWGRDLDDGVIESEGVTMSGFDPRDFPIVFGLPEWLGHVVESIDASLPPERRKSFAMEWPQAIPVGGDLRGFEIRFKQTLLADDVFGAKVLAETEHQYYAVIEVAHALQRGLVDGVLAKDEKDTLWGVCVDEFVLAGAGSLGARAMTISMSILAPFSPENTPYPRVFSELSLQQSPETDIDSTEWMKLVLLLGLSESAI